MATRKGEVRALVSALREQDFRVEPRRGNTNHYGVFTPAGDHVTDICTSPSETRGSRNCLQALRRHGYLDPTREAQRKKSARREKRKR